MEKIYFDNASTSFPKPETVPKAMYQYMVQLGSNINRGSYTNAYQTADMVYETRQLITQLFDGPDCKNVVFTKNVTESLNILLKGFLKPGDHVITSSMEHNAVMRPLIQLTRQGLTFSRIPCREDGSLPVDLLERNVTANTKAVIMTHASNVCGTLLPIQEVGAFCRRHGLYFFVDCAQTGGLYPISMKEMNIDALAFTGHKGMMGPQGIGGFLISDELSLQIEPLLSGGTGSISHTEDIPVFMPDRFEAGTMNLPGIIGLREGLIWLMETGLSAIRKHELQLTAQFLDGLCQLNRDCDFLKIVGKHDTTARTGVVSIQTLNKDLSQVAYELDDNYGIMTRVGLHCAPSAHKTLKTFPTGTLRFSFGWWNTDAEVATALNALADILKR